MNREAEILGVDIGGVVIDFIPYLNTGIDFIEIPEIEGAIESIAQLNRTRFQNRTHIVSRYTDDGPAKVLAWLRHREFFIKTGIPEENFHPCALRHEKAPICAELSITHFVDDRAEVLSHMIDQVENLYLFRSPDAGRPEFASFIPHFHQIDSWSELLAELSK